MPYTVKKNSKGKFCVHKADADGKPDGKPIGTCHDTAKKAGAQIAAIQESESGKKSVPQFNFYVHPVEDSGGNTDYSVATSSSSSKIQYWTVVDDGSITLIDEYGDNASDYVREENMEDEVKAQSIDQYRRDVYTAWDDGYDYSLWVEEIFDEYVIIRDSKQKSHYKVPYSKTDSEVTFSPRNEWAEVKLKKEWIDKAVSRLSFKDFILEEEEEVLPDSAYAIKALGENRLGAYGVLWGDDENKDLHDEYFTAETKDLTAIFDTVGVIPLIIHHAKEDEVEKFVVGVVDVMVKDSKGLWWEAKIKEFEVYKEYVEPLLSRNALFSSSGTLPAAKRSAKDGEITRWPVAEMSGTWIPAEYRMLEVPITEIKSVYSELGLDTQFISEFDENDETEEPETHDTEGAEKAQLKAFIDLKFVELGLLEIEN